MNMHYQNKLVAPKNQQFRTHNRNSHFWLYELKFSYCDLDLEDRNPFFTYGALAYNDVSPYWICLQMVQRCISSKLTLTETFNLGCDIDLEHSTPTFSLDTSLLMVIYTQTEFGCKRLAGLELIKDIVETVIFWLYKSKMWPWPWRQNPIFLHDIPAHGCAPQYQVWLHKVANKHSAEWGQICVKSVTSLTPEWDWSIVIQIFVTSSFG